MHDFSSGEGFIEVTENLSDMIKFVANEPSVGLFYVQQHAHNATSNLVTLKKNVVEKSHETSLHTEDLEDSILMVKSMKECGFPIADEMIGAIKKSLSVMSSKQPKRGVIHASSRSDRGSLGRTSSWSPATWGGRSSPYPQEGNEKTGSYFSSVFNSAKQRANNLKWPAQVDSPETSQSKDEDEASVNQSPAALSGFSTADEPLSSKNRGEVAEESLLSKSLSDQQPLISLYDNYEEFKADREAKLEEWLGGGGGYGTGGEGVARPGSAL